MVDDVRFVDGNLNTMDWGFSLFVFLLFQKCKLADFEKINKSFSVLSKLKPLFFSLFCFRYVDNFVR
jgi:hypothetical protein